MESKNLVPYIKANKWSVELNTNDYVPEEMFLHKCLSPKWVMAEDKSHEYKIDVMYTFSDDTAIRLVMLGYAKVIERKEDCINGKMSTYLEMKRVY